MSSLLPDVRAKFWIDLMHGNKEISSSELCTPTNLLLSLMYNRADMLAESKFDCETWAGVRSLFYTPLCGRTPEIQQLVQDTICKHFQLATIPLSVSASSEINSNLKSPEVSTLLQALGPVHPKTLDQALVYILLLIQASPELVSKAVEHAAADTESRRALLAQCMSVLSLEPSSNVAPYFNAWKDVLFSVKDFSMYKVGEWVNSSLSTQGAQSDWYTYPAVVERVLGNKCYELRFWDGELQTVDEQTIKCRLGYVPKVLKRGDSCLLRTRADKVEECSATSFRHGDMTIGAWVLDVEAQTACVFASVSDFAKTIQSSIGVHTYMPCTYQVNDYVLLKPNNDRWASECELSAQVVDVYRPDQSQILYYLKTCNEGVNRIMSESAISRKLDSPKFTKQQFVTRVGSSDRLYVVSSFYFSTAHHKYTYCLFSGVSYMPKHEEVITPIPADIVLPENLCLDKAYFLSDFTKKLKPKTGEWIQHGEKKSLGEVVLVMENDAYLVRTPQGVDEKVNGDAVVAILQLSPLFKYSDFVTYKEDNSTHTYIGTIADISGGGDYIYTVFINTAFETTIKAQGDLTAFEGSTLNILEASGKSRLYEEGDWVEAYWQRKSTLSFTWPAKIQYITRDRSKFDLAYWDNTRSTVRAETMVVKRIPGPPPVAAKKGSVCLFRADNSETLVSVEAATYRLGNMWVASRRSPDTLWVLGPEAQAVCLCSFDSGSTMAQRVLEPSSPRPKLNDLVLLKAPEETPKDPWDADQIYHSKNLLAQVYDIYCPSEPENAPVIYYVSTCDKQDKRCVAMREIERWWTPKFAKKHYVSEKASGKVLCVLTYERSENNTVKYVLSAGLGLPADMMCLEDELEDIAFDQVSLPMTLPKFKMGDWTISGDIEMLHGEIVNYHFATKEVVTLEESNIEVLPRPAFGYQQAVYLKGAAVPTAGIVVHYSGSYSIRITTDTVLTAVAPSDLEAIVSPVAPYVVGAREQAYHS